MTGEQEDDKGAADAREDSADDVATTTKDDSGSNDNDKKRKAEASADESPTRDTSQYDEYAEPRAKKQKQEEQESSAVDKNNNNEDDDNDNDDDGDNDGDKDDDKGSENMVEEESKETNDEKINADPKDIGDNDVEAPNSSSDHEEKDSNPSMSDNGVKDMEIDAGKDLSSVTADGKNGDKENEAKEKKNDDAAKNSPTSSANEGDESQNASKANDNGSQSLNDDKPSPSPDANKKREDAIAKNKSSNQYDNLKYIMVRNDSKPESLIKLVALKSLFSRQLPKMPRTYIARLVFDRKHISLVILNDDPTTKDTDEEVIGSICYRPFKEMRFAEIAFCAVNASHQVKGYGTKLMNLVKKEGARTGIEYFITYADNYAIGYFKKQGFTKTISMPKGRYQGLIKEYDGGTMMECYVHPSIDFTRIPEMLAAQRKFILNRIKFKALSHKVTYDPLPKNWKPHLEGVSRANESAARALAVPGMIEAGWTIADLIATTGQGKDLDRAKNALKSELVAIIRKVEDQQFAWPFREPVDTTEVNDYLDVIKEPIDLLTIDKRIRKGEHYKSKKMLYADLMLMVNNCKLYNDEASTYVQCAINLERFLKALFASK